MKNILILFSFLFLSAIPNSQNDDSCKINLLIDSDEKCTNNCIANEEIFDKTINQSVIICVFNNSNNKFHDDKLSGILKYDEESDCLFIIHPFTKETYYIKCKDMLVSDFNCECK